MNADQISFSHNESDNQFVVKTNGSQGMIEYEKLATNHLDLYHTEVDPELEGKGVAKVLMQCSLEFCKENSFQITPTCSYVAAFIQRNPEWQELVKK